MTYFHRYGVRIGVVADVFLMESLAPAADFVYLRPSEDSFAVLDTVDLFLAVSAWRGLNGSEWMGVAKKGDPRRDLLVRMVAHCRARGVPVAFYSKEDPPNYGVFADIARECDFVFTSCVETVPRYVADCGHGRVWNLPFCANPLLRRFGGAPADPRSVVFAGSFMAKYPRRCRELAALLDGAAKSGCALTVFDRNSFRSEMARYRFPDRFAPFIRPAVEHAELLEIHRRSAWAVNINTVERSATMFAARCHELSALGVCLLSNYSYGTRLEFPEASVAFSAAHAEKILSGATPSFVRFKSRLAVRSALDGRTCFDVVGELLSKTGLGEPPPIRRVAVAVPEATPEVERLFSAQSYPAKSLVLERDLASAAGEFDFIARPAASGAFDPFWLQDCVDVFKCGDFAAVRHPCGTVSAASSGSGATVDLDAFALPDAPAPSGAPALRVAVSVGGAWRNLLANSLSSLLLCESFPRLAVSLEDVDDSSPVASAVAAMVAAKYPNVSVSAPGAASAAPDIPTVRLGAADEVVPGAFDAVAARVRGRFAGTVTADAMECGRIVRRASGALRVRVRRFGLPLRVRDAAVVRFDPDLGFGEPVWIDQPKGGGKGKKKKPLPMRVARRLRKAVASVVRRLAGGGKESA